jgi:hypothetical protein
MYLGCFSIHFIIIESFYLHIQIVGFCSCDLPYVMETSLPSFLYVQYVNSNKYCKYPFHGPLCTILEITLTIDFNFKVDTIFVKQVSLQFIAQVSSMVCPSSC